MFNKMKFVVMSSDGTLFGPFDAIEFAEEWANKEEEMLGDWNIKEIYKPII